ncbi:four helix bundle protein [Maribacter sp. Hel_I_7]|uniref:four helix bundle protein n=1 Tax=unclassified Maribacter TaxID=2615042 RepID=UPI00047C427B|nr:four helix bundle protein [Maribacter sp. Hel_I_7]|tara:strand:+ start:132 stop:479 length:348 start_codon:yes stop_codon:yes gene_type:complete
MAVKRFEDLLVWQKSQDLAVLVYKDFINLKDYSFKDQISRASVSISNNIAEGFDRKTNPDFIRFLYFATSSNSEVRSMLYLSERLKYLPKERTVELIDKSNEISRMLYGLIQSMK